MHRYKLSEAELLVILKALDHLRHLVQSGQIKDAQELVESLTADFHRIVIDEFNTSGWQ